MNRFHVMPESGPAQDRIHLKDGSVIECKVTDSKNRDKKVFFLPADDPQTSHFVPTTEIEFLEIAGERIIRTPTDKLQTAKTRFPLTAPMLTHTVGATFDFMANSFVRSRGASLSYAYFFDSANGIQLEMSYRRATSYLCKYFSEQLAPGPLTDNFVIIPHYERRLYIQRIGSYFFCARRIRSECLQNVEGNRT